FSRNGVLVSLGRQGAQIWSPPYESPPAVLPAQNPESCNSGAFSPDGARYVMGDSEGSIFVWDVARRTVLRQVKVRGGIQCVVYSPDGKLIASAGGDGRGR